MFILIVTIFVYGADGQVVSASMTSAPGFAGAEACEKVANLIRIKGSNIERQANCYPAS